MTAAFAQKQQLNVTSVNAAAAAAVLHIDLVLHLHLADVDIECKTPEQKRMPYSRFWRRETRGIGGIHFARFCRNSPYVWYQICCYSDMSLYLLLKPRPHWRL